MQSRGLLALTRSADRHPITLYKIVHASRIASSISRSVTLITNNHPEASYISENHTRGILWEKLSASLGFFQFVHNTRQRGKALLGALVAALVK